jgi:hypothetical protein
MERESSFDHCHSDGVLRDVALLPSLPEVQREYRPD